MIPAVTDRRHASGAITTPSVRTATTGEQTQGAPSDVKGTTVVPA